MTRPSRRRALLAVAGMLLTATATTVTANPVTAAPASERAGAGALRTIPLGTWGKGGYLYDVNRRGQVLGALFPEGTGNSEPVLWRDYDEPVELGIELGKTQALNNRGHVAGHEGVGENTGWLWTPERVTVLSYPGQRIWVNDLNDHDQVVGDLEDPVSNAGSNAFLWQRGRFTEIVGPEGTISHAQKVNNRGEVIGYVVNADWSVNISFVWRAGTMTLLRAPGEGRVHPLGFNDRGQVVGLIQNLDGDWSHPFVWQDGHLVDLLAGQPDTQGWATGINNAGEIIGNVSSVGAVLWRDGRMIELGVSGSPRWINERGVVTGTVHSYSPDGTSQVQVYRWHRGRILLSAPVVGYEVGIGITGIDDRGRIVGRTEDPVLGHRLVAWTP